MLKCEDIARHASDHLEGQLTWRQSVGYGVHLLACGYCRHFLRHLRTTIAYARALPQQDPLSDDDAQRIAGRALDASSSRP
jgi:hypothetical protein